MSTELAIAATGLIGTILTNIVTFLLTKKKYNIEIDSQQIKNMSASFDVYKKMMDETFGAQDKKIDMLQKENGELRQQVSQLQQQMINILGSICLDSTCKLRKMNFSSDLKVSDAGVKFGE